MGYPGENRRLSEDTVSTLEMHHAFRQQFRAELAGSLKHEKATGWLSRRSKGENSLLSRSMSTYIPHFHFARLEAPRAGAALLAWTVDVGWY